MECQVIDFIKRRREQANAFKKRKLLPPDDGTTQQPASKVNVEPINAESSKTPQKSPSSARQSPSKAKTSTLTGGVKGIPTSVDTQAPKASDVTEATKSPDVTSSDKDFEMFEPVRVEKQPAKREVVEIDMKGGEEAKQEAQEETKNSFDRLQEFLQSTGQRREQVQRTNPVLWQEFVEDNVPFHTGLGSCVLCAVPNAKTQRFNTMVLCAPCIRFVLQILEQEDQK